MSDVVVKYMHVLCPHCGEQFEGPSRDVYRDEDEDEMECPDCAAQLWVTTSLDISFKATLNGEPPETDDEADDPPPG